MKLLPTLLILAFAAAAANAQDLYWEAPEILEAQGVRFSEASAGGGLIAVAWQELVPRGEGQGDIYVRMATSRDGTTWSRGTRVFGPVAYSNPEPDLQPPVYSLAVDGRGRIFLAVAVSDRTTEILSSADGRNFAPLASIESRFAAVTPDLFTTARGGYLLLLTQSVAHPAPAGKIPERDLSLYFSRSEDGRSWTSPAPFVSEEELRYSFLPQHAVAKGREFVVFQSRSGSGTYQLYLKASADGGASWGPARAITDTDAFQEVVQGSTYSPLDFTNQRPYMAAVGYFV